MANQAKGRPDREAEGPKAPAMLRSKNQLATAYAPGAFFTFEGGLGSCISVPDNSSQVDEANLTPATKEQILLRLHEVWQSWFERSMATGNDARPTDPRQCLEEALIANGRVAPLSGERVAFVNPLRMGYAPAPLTFVCNRCHIFRRFETAKDAVSGDRALTKAKCSGSANKQLPCQWRQLDVIFVHWSGEWAPASPTRWEWNEREGKAFLPLEACGMCGSAQFRLDTSSPSIGRWKFYCANDRCKHDVDERWLQHDKYTTEVLRERSRALIRPRRMEAISYRASSTFYAQSEQFILFSNEDQELLRLLEPSHREELALFIARNYRYGGGELTAAEMREKLLAIGQDKEWESYERLDKLRQTMKENAVAAGMLEQEMKKLVVRWKASDPPLLPSEGDLPDSVQIQLQARARGDYPARYDPFVLAVEHEALRKSKLSAHALGGRSPYVRFRHLDDDLAPKESAVKEAQEARTAVLMDRLGLADLGLIREFDLCRFTHGYTRVSATPTIEKDKTLHPVRLRLFEPLRDNRRPVYVVTQGNEAIYARLDPETVYAWLSATSVTDLPAWTATESVLLGGRILETAHTFGRYLGMLKTDDALTYRYVYTLLHTYAHVMMRNISELSGLDLGSLSEYVFPADLAFVVYRNGTTMDLGNLSALWRNENNRFLARMLEPETHRCNSGSLCDTGGGACPDCIMIPETSCLAQNQLLSRAVLSGGPAPREDRTHHGQRIPGYLETINAPKP